MNALLRSLALGLGIGTAVLAATLWSTKVWQSEREPKLFPAAEEALGAIPPTDADPSIVAPDDSVPMAVDSPSRVQRVVHHADGTSGPGNPPTVAPKRVKLDFISETLSSQSIRWPAPQEGTSLRLFTNTPTLHLSQTTADSLLTFKDQSTGETLAKVEKATDSTCLTQLTLSPQPRTIGIYVNASTAPDVIVKLVPALAATTTQTRIDRYAPGTNSALRKLSEESNTITLYGPAPTLRLEGIGLTAGHRLEFYLIRPSSNNDSQELRVTRFAESRVLTGGWSAEITFPPSFIHFGTPHDILAYVEVSGSTRMSSTQLVPVNAVPFRELSAPELTAIRVDGTDLKPFNGVYFTRSSKIELRTKAQDQVDFDLLALMHDSSSLLGAATLTQRQEGHLALDNLPQGRHRLVLAHQQGDGTLARSSPFEIERRTGGLVIERIEPQNFGTAPGENALRIQFAAHHPLDSTIVTKARANELFKLQRSNGTGSFDRGREATVPIDARAEATGFRYDATTNTVVLTFGVVEADLYQLTVSGSITDIYGNRLEGQTGQPGTDHVRRLSQLDPSTTETPSDVRGIVTTTGRYVPFPEYTKPRPDQNGFNPSDKVETRVARLYYFRDAHRVAQIINRKVKSHNRQGVDAARQLADRARQIAEQKAVFRQQSERAAIEKARKTREKEADLQRAEQAQQRSLQELSAAKLTDPPPDATLITQLESAARSFASQVDRLRGDVQKLRDEENVANEQVQQAEAEERLSREEQFRREVAAARADPDTYAEGVPESQDPVEQVSVSVIGEGLIQLRGPIKGINLIRTMIDQIDSPVGQVRVAVHTVQLNGERADRMEEVAATSQRYIDQARFLTLQSGELLRRSIVQVAAQRADEARALYPGETQEDRDQRYLYSFFGRDFIDELKAMDSEFLRTGNKLLSLHSMDTTSLSSALTLMALARNDTRLQILQQFEELCRGELPRAEQSFFEQSFHCGLKKHTFGSICKPPPFVSLAGNANFESLRGFFAADIANQDTMSPLQREFLRLAQILKSRLIVEMEYKQRITERAVIEERLGNREQELRDAKAKEDEALRTLAEADGQRREQQISAMNIAGVLRATGARITTQLTPLTLDLRDFDLTLDVSLTEAIASQILSITPKDPVKWNARPRSRADLDRYLAQMSAGRNDNLFGRIRQHLNELYELCYSTQTPVLKDRRDPIAAWYFDLPNKVGVAPPEPAVLPITIYFPEHADCDRGRTVKLVLNEQGVTELSKEDASFIKARIERQINREEELVRQLREYLLDENEAEIEQIATRYRDIRASLGDERRYLWLLIESGRNARLLGNIGNRVVQKTSEFIRALDRIVSRLSQPDSIVVAEVIAEIQELRRDVLCYLKIGTAERLRMEKLFDEFSTTLKQLSLVEVRYTLAQRHAETARRPLDHKKFLDMLIDETEDKYIELLEGTRAHTANIDNYIKRLTTALDDDFNTQFYNPAFRLVRESSAHRYYNVQFGQIETTSILANNRAFAKVSPAASMEFDLPQRDILITEALNGARALMNDVGALANDPTFLAMAKLNAGQSSASPPAGSTGGFSVVRNVVPGLAGDTTEQVIAQNANGGPQFGSNLENLIPDPAVYKFETGTGYEIRPVIQPDGQAVVFGFHYLYSTQIREPVRADEKHLGRIKRHFIDTDVQLSNFELREVSRYIVALKASRTSRGVPLFEDIPIAGALFRPAPSDESSLQQNVVLAQATIFPTLFDLMGLRWAPVVADLDPLRLQTDEFTVRGRNRMLRNRVFDVSSEKVDDFLRMPPGQRRSDLYRTQESIPVQHPNGYEGPGLNQQDSQLREGYSPTRTYRPDQYAPPGSREGSPFLPGRSLPSSPQPGQPPLQEALPRSPDPQPLSEPTDPRLQGASQRRSSIPPRAASATPSPPGPSSPPGTPASYGRAPSGQPPAFQVSGPQQLGR